jgi:hypothetical protein
MGCTDKPMGRQPVNLKKELRSSQHRPRHISKGQEHPGKVRKSQNLSGEVKKRQVNVTKVNHG